MNDSFSGTLVTSEWSDSESQLSGHVDSSSDTSTAVLNYRSNEVQEKVGVHLKDNERLRVTPYELIWVQLVMIKGVKIRLKVLYNTLKNYKRPFRYFEYVQPSRHIHQTISTLQEAYQSIMEILIFYGDIKKELNELNKKFRQIPSFLLEDADVKDVEELQNQISSFWEDTIKKYYLQLGDICYLLESLKEFEKFKKKYFTIKLNSLKVRSEFSKDEANVISDDIEFYESKTRKLINALRELASDMIQYPYVNLPSPELFQGLIKKEMGKLERDYHSYRCRHMKLFSAKWCPELKTRSNINKTAIKASRARVARCRATTNTGKIVGSIIFVSLFIWVVFANSFYFEMVQCP